MIVVIHVEYGILEVTKISVPFLAPDVSPTILTWSVLGSKNDSGPENSKIKFEP